MFNSIEVQIMTELLMKTASNTKTSRTTASIDIHLLYHTIPRFDRAQEKSFENIVRKGENFPFPTIFSIVSNTEITIVLATFNLSFANA